MAKSRKVPTKGRRFPILLSPDDRATLDRLAELQQRTAADVVRVLIRKAANP